MAFLLAIVFAFASNSKTPSEDDALLSGYIFKNGKCENVTVCSDIPGPLCMSNGVVARTKINETQCGSQLYHWSN